MRGCAIVDADGHVVEPESVFAEALEARFRPLAPRVVREGDRFHFESGGEASFSVQAKPESLSAPRQHGERSGGAAVARGAPDPAGRLPTWISTRSRRR